MTLESNNSDYSDIRGSQDSVTMVTVMKLLTVVRLVSTQIQLFHYQKRKEEKYNKEEDKTKIKKNIQRVKHR